MNKDQIVQSSQSSQEAESIEVRDNSGAQNLVFSPIRTRSHRSVKYIDESKGQEQVFSPRRTRSSQK